MDSYKGIAVAYGVIAFIDIYLAVIAVSTLPAVLFSALALYFLFRARQMWTMQ